MWSDGLRLLYGILWWMCGLKWLKGYFSIAFRTGLSFGLLLNLLVCFGVATLRITFFWFLITFIIQCTGISYVGWKWRQQCGRFEWFCVIDRNGFHSLDPFTGSSCWLFLIQQWLSIMQVIQNSLSSALHATWLPTLASTHIHSMFWLSGLFLVCWSSILDFWWCWDRHQLYSFVFW